MALVQPRVFISYQRSDGEFARRAREYLVAHGVQTWMDQYDIPIGAYWPDEIDKGLAASEIIVGILSPDAVESRNVKNEWDWAIANQRPLILVQTATCVIPHRYISINFIDATCDPDGALGQLTKALNGHGSIVSLPLAGTTVPVHTPVQVSVQAQPVDDAAMPPTRDTPFVGRDRELDEATTLVHAALAGQRQLLLVVGEPGIGKTRLTEELATIATAHGMQVYWGHCFEWEGAPPFWPWVELLRTYAEATDSTEVRAQLGGGAPFIAQIVPELATIVGDVPAVPAMTGEQARFRLFDAVARFAHAAAAQRPLMLVLEDLHWADEASLLLLEFVGRELKRAPLLFVGTYRDVEVRRDHPLSRVLASMARSVEPRRIVLKGVSANSIRTYISAATGTDPATPLVESIHDGTEGNPFFVAEVVRLLASEGHLDRVDGTGAVDLRVPESVREVVGRRLNQLSGPTNELLGIASVIGRDFRLRVLQQVSGHDAEAVLDALEEGIDARLIHELESVGHYRFSHALVRETLYDELRTAKRARLHAQVAAALERLYGSELAMRASELAYHYAEAAAAGYAGQAMTYATQAAEQAMAQFAWEVAIQQYRLALQMMELLDQPDPNQEVELLLALGEAQNRIAAGRQRTGMLELGAGGSPSGLQTFRRAAAIARTSGTPEQFARAALGVVGFNPYPQQGGVEGVQLLDEALGRLPDEDSPLRVLVLTRLATDPYMLAVYHDQLTFSDELQAQIRARADAAVAMARRIGDASSLAYALAIRSQQDRLYPASERLTEAEEAIEAASASGDRVTLAWALDSKALVLAELGQINSARTAEDEFARVAMELRLPFFLWSVAIAGADWALLDGRLDDAEAFLDQADEVQPVSGAGTIIRIAVLRERGRSTELLDRIAPLMHVSEPFVHMLRLACQLEVAVDEQIREEFNAVVATWLAHPMFGQRGLAQLAEVCWRLDDTEHARALYEVLQPAAGRLVQRDSSDSLGCASYFLGLLATTLERWNEAEQHFAEALALNERWEFRLYVGYTLAGWADMLARRGRPGDRYHALELLDRALALAVEIGTIRLERQAADLRHRLLTA